LFCVRPGVASVLIFVSGWVSLFELVELPLLLKLLLELILRLISFGGNVNGVPFISFALESFFSLLELLFSSPLVFCLERLR
jgi:hypothetical protein